MLRFKHVAFLCSFLDVSCEVSTIPTSYGTYSATYTAIIFSVIYDSNFYMFAIHMKSCFS